MKQIWERLRYYLGLLGLFAKYSLMEQMEYRINFAAASRWSAATCSSS